MKELFFILSLACAAAFVISGMIYVIQKLRKRATKAGLVSLILAGCAVVFLDVFFLFYNLSDGLFMLSTTFALGIVALLIVIVIRRIRRKKRLIHWLCFVLCVVLMVVFYRASEAVWAKKALRPENIEVTVQTDYDFEVKDGDVPLPTPETNNFKPETRTMHSVFESSALPVLLKKTGVTEQECIDAINNNKEISSRFKKHFIDFTHRIAEKYPQADLSILYNNLGSLQIKELSKRDYLIKSLSADSYGCYRMSENAIYIPEGTVYKEGEWGFQVLIHEFCHACRISWWNDEETGSKNRLTFQASGEDVPYANRTILEESMNSAFSCSLLNYYEKDIAYQLPSNYLRIMLECMDNYTLDDYINHSDMYFLRRLDEYTGYTNYADVMWRLITLQRYDGLSDDIDIPAEEYRPIYDYICKMYYNKYITADMDASQRKLVADELVEKAFFDVDAAQYKTDADYFYTVLDSFVPAS